LEKTKKAIARNRGCLRRRGAREKGKLTKIPDQSLVFLEVQRKTGDYFRKSYMARPHLSRGEGWSDRYSNGHKARQERGEMRIAPF